MNTATATRTTVTTPSIFANNVLTQLEAHPVVLPPSSIIEGLQRDLAVIAQGKGPNKPADWPQRVRNAFYNTWLGCGGAAAFSLCAAGNAATQAGASACVGVFFGALVVGVATSLTYDPAVNAAKNYVRKRNIKGAIEAPRIELADLQEQLTRHHLCPPDERKIRTDVLATWLDDMNAREALSPEAAYTLRNFVESERAQQRTAAEAPAALSPPKEWTLSDGESHPHGDTPPLAIPESPQWTLEEVLR